MLHRNRARTTLHVYKTPACLQGYLDAVYFALASSTITKHLNMHTDEENSMSFRPPCAHVSLAEEARLFPRSNLAANIPAAI